MVRTGVALRAVVDGMLILSAIIQLPFAQLMLLNIGMIAVYGLTVFRAEQIIGVPEQRLRPVFRISRIVHSDSHTERRGVTHGDVVVTYRRKHVMLICEMAKCAARQALGL